MKVFVSSVITGYEGYRAAAAAGARSLGNDVTVAEDYGAAPESPQVVCLRGVREADVVILLLGARYGHVQHSGQSATHEEYLEARDNGNVLAFVEDVREREANQDVLVREVRRWTGHLTAPYRTEDDLQTAVVRALHEFELARAVGPADEETLLRLALNEIPEPGQSLSSTALHLIVTGGPTRELLRPSELETAAVADELQHRALFGKHRVLDSMQGTRALVRYGKLQLQQSTGAVVLDGTGTIRVTGPLESAAPGTIGSLGIVVEEDLREALATDISFAAETLDQIDPHRRLTDVVVVGALSGSMTLGIKTRAEVAASGGTISINPRIDKGPIVVHLRPPRRHRLLLTNEAARIADDLTALMRRELQVVGF